MYRHSDLPELAYLAACVIDSEVSRAICRLKNENEITKLQAALAWQYLIHYRGVWALVPD